MSASGSASFLAPMPRLLSSRFGAVALGAATFSGVALLLRVALLAKTWSEIGFRPTALVAAFSVGLLYDLVAFLYLAIPLVLWAIVAPERAWHSRVHRWAALVFWAAWCYALFLSASVEWAFWDEFGVRFNFIAVDYLVYTKEVAGNIRETYPVGVILPAIAVPAAALFWVTQGPMRRALTAPTSLRARALAGAALLAVPAISWAVLDDSLTGTSDNRYINELGRNGTYSLFAAFWNNRLDYATNYATRPPESALARLRELVGGDGSAYVDPHGQDLLRRLRNPGPERRWNVVLITVESLSARFLTAFGDERGQRGLTPRLDALATESLFFKDYYATGIRTVRGLEAISLSVPPTPGQSVVKRPGNSGMFSLGQLFGARGYDTVFLYGGFGLFDNMNVFFGGNGFRCVDRADLSNEETTFSNVWGVCDEDLFARTLRECDAAHAAGKPFFDFVMTTSNHQPYTYPGGRIDIPSGEGRDGAVKYTDYAIGKFIDEARKRPWFDDTIFVIGADHCESARGRTDLPVDRFHIPLLIYAPRHVTPRSVSGVCSQIDLGPTLLGLLGWSYDSRFFGQDVLSHPPGRALLCNYLALGLYDGQRLATLGIRRSSRVEDVGKGGRPPRDVADPALSSDAVAWFQGAAQILDEGRHVAPQPDAH